MSDDSEAMKATAQIVAAFLTGGGNKDEVPQLVRDTMAAFGATSDNYIPRGEPAVPIAKSITPDFIICLEDGKQLKMLKRYLRTHYDMSPEEYRQRWGLPHDYPMTAPNYAKERSKLAKDIGLGTAATSSGRKAAKKKTAAKTKKR